MKKSLLFSAIMLLLLNCGSNKTSTTNTSQTEVKVIQAITNVDPTVYGTTITSDELKDMLERASSNGTELTFEEFYDIMTKKSFP